MLLAIVGLPVDDEKNRKHGRQVGRDWVAWPDLPPGTVEMACDPCGGAVHLNPESQGIREALIGDGRPVAVVCLFCIPAEQDGLTGLANGLRRLRDDQREAARISQIAAEVDAEASAERGTNS